MVGALLEPFQSTMEIFEKIVFQIKINYKIKDFIIALGKGRRVLELCSQKVDCSHFACMVAHVFACMGTLLWGENAHGMPFEAIPLAPSHAVWSK